MEKLEEIKDFLSREIMIAMYMTPDELDQDTLFSSYGLESVTLVKIVVNINKRFLINLSVQDILPYQSVNKAANFIHSILEGKIS
ncbi:acyl carrier protein [Xenorhabdus budapestensis]|uniref:Acyl carrier protein n=1 Tax=Xenorhabdus budapestensis TaxID=290110 RepID=A0ABX7VCF1_XENBU|nr:acyl carrier protein [Xenorhabdus budapestensis]QTL38549.1 acyl carrier protein [Xenorhabdus budapestensis]